MSEYMMMPGARLEIGPGGKPYESLGACCASCAHGGPCASSLGATAKTKKVAKGALRQSAGIKAMSASVKSSVASSKMLLIAGALGLGAVAFYFIRKRKKS